MEGLKCKNEKSVEKWVLTWPNMALTKHVFKTKNWSHLEEDQTVERERKRKRRRRRRGRRWRSQKGMELTLGMVLLWTIWILYGILEKFMSSKSRVC